jgi:hypothetical protein
MTTYMTVYDSEIAMDGNYADDSRTFKLSLIGDARLVPREHDFAQTHQFPATVPHFEKLIEGDGIGAVATPYSSIRRNVPGKAGVAIVTTFGRDVGVAINLTDASATEFAWKLLRTVAERNSDYFTAAPPALVTAIEAARQALLEVRQLPKQD